MSRANDYLAAVNDLTFSEMPSGRDAELLVAIAEAWLEAETTPISENEARRWSRVCSAAEKVVGL